MAATSGITALRKIQLARESVSGTNATPDIMWRGTGSIADKRKIVNVSENIGYHAPVDTTYVSQTGGTATLEADLNVEQFLHVLDAGYELDDTPAADGAGSGKIWVATLPAAAAITVPTATYTIRQVTTNGTTEWADEGAFGYVSEYTINGTPGELLKLSSTWQTRGLTTESGAEAIGLIPEVHLIPFGGAVMYIDAYNAALGGTAKSASLIGFDLSVKTGLMPAYTADRLDFTIVKYTRPEVVARITWEQNANAHTERQTHFWSQAARQMRLKFVGAALTTPGTTYTYYTLLIDIVGKWTAFDPIDSQDGNEIVTGTFTGMYDAVPDLYHRITVVNETASI